MRDPDAFDALYADARSRLLVQTFALTGDLGRAQAAVEDAFVAAWHHWRTVSAAPDPETWVRRAAWRRISRRPHLRGAGRDQTLGPELLATLAALGTLSSRQRRILVLDQATGLSVRQIAREVGVGTDQARAELAEALAKVRSDLGSGTDDAGPSLDDRRVGFARAVTGAPWSPAASLRREGSSRRRRRTVVGSLALALVLIGLGVAVISQQGWRSPLAADDLATAGSAVRISEPAPPRARLLPDDLLTPQQVARLARAATWSVPRTSDNTAGSGLVLPCQRARFAATAGMDALVRRFPARVRAPVPEVSAVQLTELTRTRRAARAAYRQALGWYADCDEPRAQLLSTQHVDGVGTDATAFVVRLWDPPVTTMTVAVARTGRATTTVARLTRDDGAPAVGPVTSLIAAGVNGLCGSPGAARCASPPALVERAPFPVGPVPGMLAVVDLPPVTGVDAPWVATAPERATTNLAATRCDETEFTGRPTAGARTRSFLITEADLPVEFGLTQTVGVLPSRARAAAFVEEVRGQMAVCEEGDLGTEVDQLEPTTGAVATGPVSPEPEVPGGEVPGEEPSQEPSEGAEAESADPAGPGAPPPTSDDPREPTSVAMWQVTTEISDEQSVRFTMAIVRSGRVVSQIGFVPVAGADIDPAAFARLVERALERLPSYPLNPH